MKTKDVLYENNKPGFERYFGKPPYDKINYSNWREPTNDELWIEYRFEWMKNWSDVYGDPFDGFYNFVSFVNESPVIKLTEESDKNILNRSNIETLEKLWGMVQSYQYPRPVFDLAHAIKNNEPLPYPLIMILNDYRVVLGGNTRLDIAFMFGIEPHVKLLDVDSLLD